MSSSSIPASHDRRIFRESIDQREIEPKKSSKEKTFLGFLYFNSEMKALKQWPEMSASFIERPLEGDAPIEAQPLGLTWEDVQSTSVQSAEAQVQAKPKVKAWRP